MLFLDLLLLIMTSVCVIYCWILNKRIHDLQNSRIEFARMIKELNVSIIKAENNVNEMSELSKLTSAEIRSVVEEARSSSSELISICEVANELSLTLANQVKVAKTQLNSNIVDENNSEYYENYVSKSSEKFNEEDFAPKKDEEPNVSKYTNHLKNFIQTIVSKKSDENAANLNQTNYYETLRKINLKK